MYHTLTCEERKSKHVKNAHQLRKEGKIPAILFGKNFDPVSLQIPYKDFKKIHNGHIQVMQLQYESGKHLCNVESIQKDPVTNQVLHISFHRIKKGEKTKVHLPFVVIGRDKRMNDGGVVTTLVSEVEAHCDPANVPESIEIDVSALKVGEHILLKDIKLPKGLEISDSDLELNIVNCAYPKVQEVPEETKTEEAVEVSSETASSEQETVEDKKAA